MNIIFNHAISNIRVYPKVEDWLTNYKVVNDFKLRVGYKFFVIPVYKVIPKAVVRGWNREFVCDANEFKHDRLFIEDDKFYYRPHCIISLNNKSHQDVYFDSVEDLDKYVSDLILKAPHIICK